MNTLGIIAEYNPFHNGHLYQLAKAKKQSEADYVVIVMSGNYVQRGVPAITDKYTRTRMALACGADLVLELPVRYATGSAREFAFAGIQSLHALSAVNAVSFGCEAEGIAILNKTADLLATREEELESEISTLLKDGYSYPSARAMVLCGWLSDSGTDSHTSLSAILTGSNTILALEYLRAIKKLKWNPSLHIIKRKGAGYHDTMEDSRLMPVSANGIRESYLHTKDLSSLQAHMPPQAYEILSEAEKKSFPIIENDFSDFLFYTLLKENEHTLLSYEGMTANLVGRIQNKYNDYQCFSKFVSDLHTKNYTTTHIQRALLHAILDIKKIPETVSSDAIKQQNLPLPYLRVLGLKKSASHLLKSATLPVINKVADAEKLLRGDTYASMLLDEDIRATHLYNYVLHGKFQANIADEYRHGPVII